MQPPHISMQDCSFIDLPYPTQPLSLTSSPRTAQRPRTSLFSGTSTFMWILPPRSLVNTDLAAAISSLLANNQCMLDHMYVSFEKPFSPLLLKPTGQICLRTVRNIPQDALTLGHLPNNRYVPHNSEWPPGCQ